MPKALYPHDYGAPHCDCLPYRPVEETTEQIEHARHRGPALARRPPYQALLLDLIAILQARNPHAMRQGTLPWYNEL
jgi:hypothetical protein